MTSTNHIDIHALLAERNQIAIIWSIEDVQAVRPDLTDDQAWEVLQHVEQHHDAELGITWMAFEYVAEDMFPEPSATTSERSRP